VAVPKRRQSRARTRKRKAVWLNIPKPNIIECPQCHEPKLNHRVCPSCGYYKNREVIKSE